MAFYGVIRRYRTFTRYSYYRDYGYTNSLQGPHTVARILSVNVYEAFVEKFFDGTIDDESVNLIKTIYGLDLDVDRAVRKNFEPACEPSLTGYKLYFDEYDKLYDDFVGEKVDVLKIIGLG